MPPRSRCLWAPTRIPSTAPVLLYTAPAGYYVIVHSIRVVNVTGSDEQFTLGLDELDPWQTYFLDAPVLAHEVLVDPTWHVLPDAAEVWFTASNGDAFVTTGSGAVLGP